MRRAAVGLIALALALGCGASPKDLERWELEEDGPEKLAAVVRDSHAKIAVRRDAALALTRLVQKNRRVGLDVLVSALTAIEDTERARVIDAVAPTLVKDTRLPRPAAVLEKEPAADDPRDEVGSEMAPDGDPSLAAKDAVHALLARDLVASAPQTEALRAALLAWIETSTVFRMREPRQRYSVEQSMRLLGPVAVKRLPESFALPQADVIDLGSLIDEIGAPETKLAAIQTLIDLAHSIASPSWLTDQRPIVEETNRRMKVQANSRQVTTQVEKYRELSLGRVLVALSILGGQDSVAELVLRASDPRGTTDSTTMALLALEPHMRSLDAAEREAVFVIAGSDDPKRDPNTPIGSKQTSYPISRQRSAAFACIARLETTPELITRLFAMFSLSSRARLAAAQAVIDRMEAKDLDVFMQRLATSTETAHLDPDEPLVYGPALARRFGSDAVRPYLARREIGPRLTAIAAFGEDQEAVRPFADDHTLLPACKPDAEPCSTRCGSLFGGEVKTVGDFVHTCAGKEPGPTRDERLTFWVTRLKRRLDSAPKNHVK